MIAHVDLRLRREALRGRMCDALRRKILRKAGEALDETEGARPDLVPDEKLTGDRPPDGLSRNV
ncbi:hypothetical protein [Aureimonas sp. SK2]|uniref:hypothetical protein n=1 Tax=Aureimonas sp. SK2 TaxID=3015992 RepID=UPI0024446371|nr:hypothetical protein [Aureimonas sp. SK2]